MSDELILLTIVFFACASPFILLLISNLVCRYIYHRVHLYPTTGDGQVIVLERAKLFKRWKRSGDTPFDRYDHYYSVYTDDAGKYYVQYTRRFVFIEERWVKRYDTWQEIAEEYLKPEWVEASSYFSDRAKENES